jgi:hypothetical protein
VPLGWFRGEKQHSQERSFSRPGRRLVSASFTTINEDG